MVTSNANTERKIMSEPKTLGDLVNQHWLTTAVDEVNVLVQRGGYMVDAAITRVMESHSHLERAEIEGAYNKQWLKVVR